MTGFVQFLFPLAESVGRGDALGADHAVILGEGRIALLMLLRLAGAAVINRRIKLARCCDAVTAPRTNKDSWPSTPRPRHRRCLVNRAGRRGTGRLLRLGDDVEHFGQIRRPGFVRAVCFAAPLSVFGENHKSTEPLPLRGNRWNSRFILLAERGGLLRLAVLARRVGVGFEPLPIFLIGCRQCRRTRNN